MVWVWRRCVPVCSCDLALGGFELYLRNHLQAASGTSARYDLIECQSERYLDLLLHTVSSQVTSK